MIPRERVGPGNNGPGVRTRTVPFAVNGVSPKSRVFTSASRYLARAVFDNTRKILRSA